jgi:hypothetical protein
MEPSNPVPQVGAKLSVPQPQQQPTVAELQVQVATLEARVKTIENQLAQLLRASGAAQSQLNSQGL